MFKKIILTSLLLTTSVAFAGNEKGNGGVSVVCRDENKQIVSAQLLDLFEGEVRYHKVYESKLDVDSIVQLAELKLLKPTDFYTSFQDKLVDIKAAINFISSEVELLPTNDALPLLNKKGCTFEQLANYTEEGDLLVSEEIYSHLDNLNQAALLVHEVVYSILRDRGATDSRQARKLTAELLAKNGDQNVITKIIGHTFSGRCGTQGTLEQRIQSCNKRNASFSLVTKTKDGFEVWKDNMSGLLWGDRVSSYMSWYDAKNVCSSSLAEVGNLGEVEWRLPSLDEYSATNSSNFRNLLPNKQSLYWTNDLEEHSRQPWVFGNNKDLALYASVAPSTSNSVRCVANTK